MSDDLATLRVEDRGEVVIALLGGEVDVSMAARIGDQIAEAVPASAHALVVDMSELGFIDSSGIAMLFSLARRLTSRRQQLSVVAPEGQPVVRVLELVEFERAAPVHADLEAAMAELGAG